MKKLLIIFVIIFPVLLLSLALRMEINGVQDQANILLSNPLFFVLYAVLIAPLIEEFTFRYLLQRQFKSKRIIRYFIFLLQLTYVLVAISSPLSFYIAFALILSYVLFENGQKLGFVAIAGSSSIAFILLHINMSEPYDQILKLIFLYTIMTVVFVVVRIKVGFAQGIVTHMWYNFVQCALVLVILVPEDHLSKSYSLRPVFFSWGSSTHQANDSLYFRNVNLVDIAKALSTSKVVYSSEFATFPNWSGTIYNNEGFIRDISLEHRIKLDTCSTTFTHYRVRNPRHPSSNSTLFFSTWLDGEVNSASTMRNLLNATNFDKQYTIEWNEETPWADSVLYFDERKIYSLDFTELKASIGFETEDSTNYPVDMVILRHPFTRWLRSTQSICSKVE